MRFLGAFFLFWLTVWIASFAGWVTHIVHSIQHQEWLMLIAGAVAFPVGVVHGWGLWFHWWN